MITPVEFKAILGNLNTVMVAELIHMLTVAPDSKYVVDAFPEVVSPYIGEAADLSVVWYDSMATTPYRATPAPLPPVQQLQRSAGWTLAQRASVELLTGSAQRYLYNGSRNTVRENVRREPRARFARYASATACRFCQMLTTRDGVYSEETADFQAHDNCRCLGVPVRPGGSFDRPAYMDKWQEDYQEAAKLADSTSLPDLMKAYRQMDKE